MKIQHRSRHPSAWYVAAHYPAPDDFVSVDKIDDEHVTKNGIE